MRGQPLTPPPEGWTLGEVLSSTIESGALAEWLEAKAVLCNLRRDLEDTKDKLSRLDLESDPSNSELAMRVIELDLHRIALEESYIPPAVIRYHLAHHKIITTLKQFMRTGRLVARGWPNEIRGKPEEIPLEVWETFQELSQPDSFLSNSYTTWRYVRFFEPDACSSLPPPVPPPQKKRGRKKLQLNQCDQVVEIILQMLRAGEAQPLRNPELFKRVKEKRDWGGSPPGDSNCQKAKGIALKLFEKESQHTR